MISRSRFIFIFGTVVATLFSEFNVTRAEYVGSASTVSPSPSIQNAALEILGNGGGLGNFIYKGGGNAVDAAVASALAACVVNPGNASLGGYGGHMMIYKSGADGETKLVTCIDFNTAAGSLASSNMFLGSVNLTNGHWTGAQPPANETGWKSVSVPGTFAGLFVAQTNYGRKVRGTNYFPFAEILKPALARIANGDALGTAYYTLSSVSNLFMDLYTNSPGYLDTNGNPNPFSNNDPYAVFYSGDIAVDIATAMQANGGLVTYDDLKNYKPREVTPYSRHFNPPNGTPATVYVAPPGSAGVSVLQQIAMIEALGWTNGPTGAWDSLHYWHSRAEASRLMWKDHFQWIGDPWSGISPPDFLGNGSTNFADQLLAHVTNGYPFACPWDANEIRLTNSLARLITDAVNNHTNNSISTDWDDVRYGTRNISVSDKWGNCVVVTFSMGNGFSSQAAVPSRGLVFGQGMSLFDLRPGWPDSIAPGKRPVDNMCPAIVIPDFPISPTNGTIGGRPPLAIGGVGGSTIENNMAMHLIKYLTDPPSSSVIPPAATLYNFEANKIIYMRSSYPTGVQNYFGSVGYSAPGGPPSVGEVSYAQAWISPAIVTQPVSQDVTNGATVNFDVTATGLPISFQWFKNGVSLSDGVTISGSQTSQLTVNSVTNGAAFTVIVFNGGSSVTSAPAAVTIQGAPAIVTQPVDRGTSFGTPVTFSAEAVGSAPLTYRWLKNGVPLANGGNISGATNTTLNVANVSDYDVGTYAVVVTNFFGNVMSTPVSLLLLQTNPPNLFLYEPFDYANIGNPVGNNTPTNWAYNGSGIDDLNVTSGNLFWPGLAPSLGNSVTNGGTGLGARRLFGTNVSSGKIYFSALFRINDLGFGAWNGLASQVGALTAPDNTGFRLQVMIRSNSPNGYVLGVQKGGTGATPTFQTTERHAGETIFLVGKYDFTVASNAVTLWVNPATTTFGSTTDASTNFVFATNGVDGFTIDRFNMRQNAATGSSSVPANMQWDELRFGLTWASVTPPAWPAKITDVRTLGSSTIQFTYANGGVSYNIFASTNLIDWQSIGAAVQTSPGIYQFTDTNANDYPERFYQLRSP